MALEKYFETFKVKCRYWSFLNILQVFIMQVIKKKIVQLIIRVFFSLLQRHIYISTNAQLSEYNSTRLQLYQIEQKVTTTTLQLLQNTALREHLYYIITLPDCNSTRIQLSGDKHFSTGKTE